MTALALAPLAAAPSIASEHTSPDGFHLVVEENGRRWFEADADDPIFATIEAHRSAQEAFWDFGEAQEWELPRDDTHPLCIEYHRLADAMDGAGEQITGIIPTTFGGVAALVDYISDHDEAKFARSPTLHSTYLDWPQEMVDGAVVCPRGYPLSRPFHSWIISNIGKALKQLQGRA